jgi:three-Cys-motif partner protein
MQIPAEYHGREQTFLKHRVLKEYLVAWGHKLGSLARTRQVKLWYVDCFAGPWRARNENLADTSISIGLQALEEAATTWGSLGYRIDSGAIFVEPDDDAYQRLEEYLAGRRGGVQTHPFHGDFEDFIDEIGARIGDEPAFLFVDPTGWKGAAMRFMQPLMRTRRDLMVNVMFNHVNRFKDDPRTFLRDQMRDFFGLGEGDVPRQLDEEGLMSLYRAQLKQRCRLKFAADLAVPHPTQDRTWFRLVVGGNHPAVIELFREVERKVVGEEAGPVREEAARRRREDRAPQLELRVPTANIDRRYEDLRGAGFRAIEHDILTLLQEHDQQPFKDLWPAILERHHVTKPDVATRVCELHREKKLVLRGIRARERTAKDDHIVTLPPTK